MIWFTSDTHFGHQNIVKGVSKWTDLSRCRNFETQEEHDKAIIDGINKYVQPDDILFHMGDFSFGGYDNIWKYRKAINCCNIEFFIGNHDHHIENNKILDINGVKTDVRSLFKSVEKRGERRIAGHDFVFEHYSLRTWDKAHHGTIMLYGHSHDTLPAYGNFKTMDVGVDVAFRIFGEYRPFSLEEILEIMKKKVPLTVDHHDKNTPL